MSERPFRLQDHLEFDVINKHRYNYRDKGDKPDDPGWQVCTCGAWQGYWSGFNEHVAEAVATFLAEHDRQVAKAALLQAADDIDRGPTFPMPPSVISALLREIANDDPAEESFND